MRCLWSRWTPRLVCMTRQSGDVVVRRAAFGDAAAIAHVRIASWREGYRGIAPQAQLDSMDEVASAEQWRGWLVRAHTLSARVFVGVLAGRVEGVSLYHPVDDEAAGAELRLMYVHPQVWSRGIGSAMLRTCMADMSRCRLGRGHLWVARDSVRSRGFYAAHGWTPTGEADDDRSIPVVGYEITL